MANDKDHKAEAPKAPAREYADASKITHHQDIERLYRLGMLSPKDVARFTEAGQLRGIAPDQVAE